MSLRLGRRSMTLRGSGVRSRMTQKTAIAQSRRPDRRGGSEIRRRPLDRGAPTNRRSRAPHFGNRPEQRSCTSSLASIPVDVISVVMVALLPLVPLTGEYHRRPAIPTPFLVQATQGRKIHMRPRDQKILARELRQQLMPRRRSRSLVDVENRGDLGMLQLDAQCMDDVAPKQDLLAL